MDTFVFTLLIGGPIVVGGVIELLEKLWEKKEKLWKKTDESE